MTEQEAIEVLKNNYPKMCKMVNGRYQGGFDNTESDFGQALTMAISVLKEIQQYREIGTVEECREAVEKQKAKNPSVHKQQYSDAYNCSKCGWTFIHKNETGWFCGQHYKFCPNCGQAIRWNENLEGME